MTPPKSSAGRHPEDPRRTDAADAADPADRDDRTGRDRRSTPLAGLGPALRRLRMHRGLRQYEAARSAGVTKAMLSAYETGKRNPSIRTLDSLLAALDASLGDLHLALVADRRERALLDAEGSGADELRERGAAWGARGRGLAGLDVAAGYPPWAPPGAAGPSGGAADELYRALGVRGPLPAQEERAFREMLHGFLRLLRYMHRGVDG